MEQEEKKQISFGKLVVTEDFKKTLLIPENVRNAIKSTPYYLFIFIPADEIVKISIFPCKNKDIKKILIKLKGFSPELVKGISTVLKNFNLGDGTIHTTGLCFSDAVCYYETYLDFSSLKARNISLDNITKEFLNISTVQGVEIINIVLSPL